ncbi:putative late blight resistance protein homolog R1B-17 [Nicotiana tabacum]|uniref:Late blight resistance protein homolog R1B-17 n=1 Tax=Nicotiana tabacum TaxID=4097 RepID=A0A1S4DKC1_TOBAC|nr:PREDICTED: putative late blight resistance protein homolog R1B-17 [Nicotiana tabacum]
MKSTLMETSSDETQVVAIVGMGGIGKTTFARRIYDDLEIKSHFDILAWVTMSKEYGVRKMLLQLLHCIPSTEAVSREATDDGELADKLKQKLWKRRYLVVIDDIWSTKAWDDISQWFPDSKGSHALLTTRCGNVASYAASGKPPHHMSPLSAKESWELLQSKVELSPELLEVGKKIADNCHGVPLAVTVVAGLLSKCNNALDRWEQVAEDVKSAIFKDPGQQCEKVLALSYYYLPQHLKGCFLYFGIFSQDDEINVTTLINLWVAEGILKEVDYKSLEDVAEEYLQELIDRNWVLVGQQNFCGDVETCRIHDLLHELCLRQARSENFLPVIDDKPPYRASRVPQSFMQVCVMIVRSIGGFHRLNSHSYDQKVIRTIVYQGEHAYYAPRNKYLLVVDNERGMREISEFKNSKMIRVLALRKLCFHNDIPASLFDLVNLRYLSLSIDSPKFLPLLKLQRLQVLTVEIENFASNMIPLQIWRMPQLRSVHFIKTRWRCPPNMANAEGKQVILEHLHTLSGVGPAWCKNEIFALMPNLNKLEIVLDRSVDDQHRDLWIAISYLPLVETLRIKAGWWDFDERCVILIICQLLYQ